MKIKVRVAVVWSRRTKRYIAYGYGPDQSDADAINYAVDDLGDYGSDAQSVAFLTAEVDVPEPVEIAAQVEARP